MFKNISKKRCLFQSKQSVISHEKELTEKFRLFLRGCTTRTKIVSEPSSLGTAITLTLGVWPAPDGAVPYEIRINRRKPESEVEVYLLSGIDGSIIKAEWFGGGRKRVMPRWRELYFREVVLKKYISWLDDGTELED